MSANICPICGRWKSLRTDCICSDKKETEMSWKIVIDKNIKRCFYEWVNKIYIHTLLDDIKKYNRPTDEEIEKAVDNLLRKAYFHGIVHGNKAFMSPSEEILEARAALIALCKGEK